MCRPRLKSFDFLPRHTTYHYLLLCQNVISYLRAPPRAHFTDKNIRNLTMRVLKKRITKVNCIFCTFLRYRMYTVTHAKFPKSLLEQHSENRMIFTKSISIQKQFRWKMCNYARHVIVNNWKPGKLVKIVFESLCKIELIWIDWIELMWFLRNIKLCVIHLISV